MAKTYAKNGWSLFLILLVGIVVGSFLGQLIKEVDALKWINYGIAFAIGDTKHNNIVTLDLGVLAVSFGLRLKVTIGSVIGAVAAVIIYKKVL